MFNKPLDFSAVNSAAMAHFPALLNRLLPSGYRSGSEWVALNPTRGDRRSGSFRISLTKGCWRDFATDEGGSDPVSLIAYLCGVSQGEGARRLAVMLGMEADHV